MSNGSGTYGFLSWLRQGIGTAIESSQGDAARAQIRVAVTVDGLTQGSGQPAPVELAVFGPGEVTGFDPRVVVRTWPKAEVYDAEDNFFPLIEFAQSDLPWRYTPLPHQEGRLLPWFCLLALKDDEHEFVRPIVDETRPLPLVKVHPGTPLPKLSQAWAWAHVQVSGEPNVNPGNLFNLLTNESWRLSARLLCPRRLESKKAYTVVVVPTFERGRLTGLGEAISDNVTAQKLSWDDAVAEARDEVLELSVYYSWRFQTGPGGDFEHLVSLLKMNPLRGAVGSRGMDVSDPGAGLPGASVAPMGLEGALRTKKTGGRWGEVDPRSQAAREADAEARALWNRALKALLNGTPLETVEHAVLSVLTAESGFNMEDHVPELPLTQNDLCLVAVAPEGGGRPDLVSIRRGGSHANAELRTLMAESGYGEVLGPTDVPLRVAAGDVAITVADWHGAGELDLMVLQGRADEPDRRVLVLPDVSRYESLIPLLRQFREGDVPGPLPEWDFLALAVAKRSGADTHDLLIVQASPNGGGNVWVTILSGESEFKEVAAEFELPFGEEPRAFTFTVVTWEGNSAPQFLAVRKLREGTTQAFILSPAGIEAELTLLVDHVPDYACALADWDADGRPDLVLLLGGAAVLVLPDMADLGSLIDPEARESARGSFATTVADWDGNGQLDLFTVAKRVTSVPAGPDRPTVLPLYGRWHAARTDVAIPGEQAAVPPWFHELNLDPRLRVAAGLGVRVVQERQQQLVAGAWRQVEGILSVNAELRQAQLAREVAARLYARHLVPGNIASILYLTAPLHRRVSYEGRDCKGILATNWVKHWLDESPIREGALDAQWRRLTRRGGPLGRRLDRRREGEHPSVLERLNRGGLSPAPPPPDPNPEIVLTFSQAGINFSNLDLDSLRVPPWPGTRPTNYNPYDPDYTFLEPPQDVPGDEGGEWAAFGEAVATLFADLKRPPEAAPQRCPVDLEGLNAELVNALEPRRNIERGYEKRLKRDDKSTWQGGDPLGEVMAAPRFTQPMYEPLRDLSQDWLLPGLEKVPPNTLALLFTNERFIEAYMVGLNHEMARELLWNGYPTDQRGSYFRHFWDSSGFLQGASPSDPTAVSDIAELYAWKSALGKHFIPTDSQESGGGQVVLLLRGDLLRRYPSAILYATRATLKETIQDDQRVVKRVLGDKEEHPIFTGTLEPDVSFFKFNLTEADVTGTPGWFFVLQEQPTEPRFGLNSANEDFGNPVSRWEDLSWSHLAADETALKKLSYIDLTSSLPALSNLPDEWHVGAGESGSRAANIAVITLQTPVRVAVHASDLLGGEEHP